VEIPYIEGEEVGFQSSPVIEEPIIPTQTRSYFKSTTTCVSPQSEITFEDLSKSIIVSQGVQSVNSQSSGSSTKNQNQGPPTSPRGGNTQTNMAGIDNTLRLLEFKGVGLEDLKQYLFV
jgi:hypothetical protein